MAPQKKGIAGKEAFSRMNFLYQASSFCSSLSSAQGQTLSAYYGSVFRNVAKKACVRAEPELKRTLCKGCNAVLVPGKNARVRLKKKPTSRLIVTCLSCATLKRFGVRKDYKIWLEKDDSVVERFKIGNSVSRKVGDRVDHPTPIESSKPTEVKNETDTRDKLLESIGEKCEK